MPYWNLPKGKEQGKPIRIYCPGTFQIWAKHISGMLIQFTCLTKFNL